MQLIDCGTALGHLVSVTCLHVTKYVVFIYRKSYNLYLFKSEFNETFPINQISAEIKVLIRYRLEMTRNEINSLSISIHCFQERLSVKCPKLQVVFKFTLCNAFGD